MKAGTGELVRFYSDEGHARQFVERGIIRLGSLGYYRGVEDAGRRDPTEGQGRFRTNELDVATVHLDGAGRAMGVTRGPGVVNRHVGLTNIVYIMSCCDPSGIDPTRLRGRFGQVVVRISDPAQLCDDLTAYCQRQPARSLLAGAFAEIVRVTYDKGELLAGPLDPSDLSRAYTQKPRRFEDESECRIVIVAASEPPAGEIAPEHLIVDIGGPLSYAEIVSS